MKRSINHKDHEGELADTPVPGGMEDEGKSEYMQSMKFYAVLFVITAVTGTAAAAPKKSGPPGCETDTKLFCASVTPGSRRIATCLEHNRSRISKTCRDSLDNIERSAKSALTLCESPAKRFCAAVDPGQGRIVTCLKQYLNRLPGSCRAAIEGL